MKFGVRVPSFAWPDLTFANADTLLDYCRRVEDLPFCDIWALDHLLVASALYGVSWLDPLIVLSAIAPITTRVGLGTSALVLPLRHPVLLAKDIATLQHLSQGRFIFGVATGWDEKEFQALGIPLKERGRRTDEILDLTMRLLTEEDVSYSGRFYQLDGVTIYPRLPEPPPVWVAGGSLGHAPETPDKPHIAPAVLRRIARAQGWMSRSSGSDVAMIEADWKVVQTYLRDAGRDPASIVFAHTQFVHIVESSSEQDALDEQIPHFVRIMGTHRTQQELAASYLLGTVEQIQRRVGELAQAGLQYMILTPVSEDPGQLDLLVKHLIEPFSEP